MKLEENIDYYIDEVSGLMVLTSHYLLNRGYCCNNKCRECPYEKETTKKLDDSLKRTLEYTPEK